MKKLDGYIGVNYAAGFLLVLAVLVSLFSIVELVTQLDDIGKEGFRIREALLYVLLTVPGRVGDLTPVSALLGGIVALGMMADRNELLAMEAAGLSVRRIGGAVLGTALLFALAAGLLGEWVAPPLEQRARALRIRGFADPGILLTKHGFWARRDNAFIHVGKVLHGGRATDIDLYEQDKHGRLGRFVHARAAEIHDDKTWLLRDIEEKTLRDGCVTTRDLPGLTLKSFLSTDQIAVLEHPPDSLSAFDLHHYIGALRNRGQNVDHYSLALWRKLVMPLTTCAMVLFSLPFVLGPPRVRTAGFRITVASVAGVAFYLGNEIAGYLGILLRLHPALTTMVPVAAVVVITFGLFRRGR